MAKQSHEERIAASAQKLREKGFYGEVVALMPPSNRKHLHDCERTAAKKKS
jgi:hypothetical protein